MAVVSFSFWGLRKASAGDRSWTKDFSALATLGLIYIVVSAATKKYCHRDPSPEDKLIIKFSGIFRIFKLQATLTLLWVPQDACAVSLGYQWVDTAARPEIRSPVRTAVLESIYTEYAHRH